MTGRRKRTPSPQSAWSGRLTTNVSDALTKPRTAGALPGRLTSLGTDHQPTCDRGISVASARVHASTAHGAVGLLGEVEHVSSYSRSLTIRAELARRTDRHNRDPLLSPKKTAGVNPGLEHKTP
jgi:hypothetical protein